MTVWSWLRLTLALWLVRKAAKAAGWLIAAVVAVAAWPLTIAAAIGCLAAWLRGWAPARLWQRRRVGAAVTVVYAIGEALRLRAWPTVALAPVNDWGQAWRLLAGHSMVRAGLLVAPVNASGGTRPGPRWAGSPRPAR